MPSEVSPYLYYEDAGAAMDWLIEAFGFEDAVFLGAGVADASPVVVTSRRWRTCLICPRSAGVI